MSPYSTPVVLWLTSALGLVVMLLGDGAWDIAGLLALCLPVLTIGRAWLRGTGP
jgi:hypothetical protein